MLDRYDPITTERISEAFRRFGLKKGKGLTSKRKQQILEQWEKYPADVVCQGISRYLNCTTRFSPRVGEKFCTGLIKRITEEGLTPPAVPLDITERSKAFFEVHEEFVKRGGLRMNAEDAGVLHREIVHARASQRVS